LNQGATRTTGLVASVTETEGPDAPERSTRSIVPLAAPTAVGAPPFTLSVAAVAHDGTRM